MICRRQVADLIPKQADFEENALKLTVIGNGNSYFIQAFREDTGFQGEIYTDPTRQSYKLLGFKKDVTSSLNMKTLKTGLKGLIEGHSQKSIQGDPWQQGGVIVITPEQSVPFFYVNQEAGDYAPPNTILMENKGRHRK
ncbi:MAG: AhpC/TSA family protein [SAR324 cluster bacterium]|nr:AhpC/TSA family protein [SAR324 cluster bacterium]